MKRPEVAFILAAGRGERLRPLTDKTPKPLLPYKGRPLLDHVLDSLAPLKLKRIVFNAWHLADQVLNYAEGCKKRYPYKFDVSVEHELLGTGGGLKKALALIQSDSFLMLNGDCLWTGDILKFLDKTAGDSGLATWWLTAAQPDQTKIRLKGRRLVGLGSLWGETSGEREGCFSGIQLIRKLQPEKLPEQGCIVRNYYVPLLQSGESLEGEVEGLQTWTDVGTVERYQALTKA